MIPVNSCYDGRRPLQSMSVRALMAALMVVLSSAAEGETLAVRKPWHADVPSPRAGLPAVTIDFGYPGPYVPMLSTPITIRATAADIPFDGYIGYHFGVRDLLTLDTSVIARAKLRPHEAWSFTTTATLRKCCIQNIRIPREIEVQWRNRSMQWIASSSAGVPPWTSWDEDLLPLAVAGVNTAQVLGTRPYVERAEALSDQSQWYAGFSAVVIPVATWLDLPERIREAIFSSGVYVVFFGFPRPDQRMGRLDRTLLPVAFSARPGSYDAPWPYRSSSSTPLSWVAKEGSYKIGSDQNPYIARTNAAAWGADDVAVTRPLPAMARIGSRRSLSFDELQLETGDWSDESRRHLSSVVAKRQFLSVYSGAAAAIVAIVIAIAAWMLLRQTPRTVVAVVVVLAATLLIAERSRIRPPSGVRDYTIRAPIAPGIVDHFHIWRAYGPTPLAEPARVTRTSITGDYGNREDAEVRTSETPSSMGLLNHHRDWDAVTRWSYQRELSSNSSINRTTITGAAPDYHSPLWFWVVERPSGNNVSSRMETRLKVTPDGRATCTFALPSDIRAAVVKTSFNGGGAEITWPAGSAKVKFTKNIYSYSSAEIPTDVLRQIAAHGGIAGMTFDHPVESPYNRVWIEIRE